MDQDNPCCPKHPKIQMEKKQGRYGPFWGCPRFPKCKETIHIERKQKFLKLGDHTEIKKMYSIQDNKNLLEYFISTAPFLYVKTNIDPNRGVTDVRVLKAIGLIENGQLKQFVDSSLSCTLYEWMHKRGKYHYVVFWAYFIFKMINYIPKQWDFFLSADDTVNSKNDETEPTQEWHIKAAIRADTLQSSIFPDMYIEIKDFEWAYDNGIIDILGIHKHTMEPIAIEVKKKAHKNAVGQIIRYRNALNTINHTKSAGYIIAKGYPRELLESSDRYLNTIGLISFTIEDESILLIPWRNADFICQRDF